MRIFFSAALVLTVSVFILIPPSNGRHGTAFHGPGSTGWLATCTSTDSSGNPITCPADVAFRDWRYLLGNANNPVVPSNTGRYNAVNMGNPYLAPQNLVNGTWHGFGQCSPAGADLNSNSGYPQICMTHSSDLVHWTNDDALNPVISAVANTWMHQYLLHPVLSPTCNLATYCMYFSARDNTGTDSIGLFLANTITGPWTAYSGNPVIPSSATCVGNHHMLPTIIQIGTTKYMYTAYGDNTGQTIAYWTAPASSDTAWTCGGTALRAPQSGDWDATGAVGPYGKTVSLYGLVDPWVWKNRHGFYEMLYTAVTTSAYNGNDPNYHTGGQAGGYAVSVDAINWHKYRNYPVISLEAVLPGQSFRASSCGDPTATNGTAGNHSVIEVGNTLYYTPICVNGGWVFTMPDY